MRPWPSLTLLAAIAFASLCLSSGTACAYIDPGTGSYLFQMAMASALAAAFVLKAFWGRIKAACKGFFLRPLRRLSVAPTAAGRDTPSGAEGRHQKADEGEG